VPGSPGGLTSREAARLQARFGRNSLKVKDEESLWEELLESLREPLQLLLLAVGILYAVFGELRDAAIIFAVIITVASVETWTEWRAGRAIAALSKLSAPQAVVWRDGMLRQIPSEELVPGDLISLVAGSRVAADARLVESDALAVDQSLVTGESAAVEKGTAPGEDAELLAGTLVVSGRATATVTAIGQQSTLGRIAGLVATGEPPKTPLQLQMAELARVLLIAALAVSVIVPLIGIATGKPVRDMILTGLTLAFATIPEELPILIVIVLGLGSLQLARDGAIVRRLVAAETLGATTVVCTDKTGTLTQNRIVLDGVQPASQLLEAGSAAAANDDTLLLAARVASERPAAGVTRFVDPIDSAVWAPDGGPHPAELDRRFPFDRERRLASGVVTADGGFVLGCKGAPEAIVARSAAWRSPGGPRPMQPSQIDAIVREAAESAQNGGRVLAVASRRLEAIPDDRDSVERDLVFEGLLVFRDPLRPEVPSAIEELREAGVAISIVTGDQAATAIAVGHQAGLDLPAFTATQIKPWTDGELADRAKAGAVFARILPEDKLRIVRSLDEAGQVVAVTGDGVNDAPALRAATIGVAMGRGGTDVAREAADLVITDDNFATLVHAVEGGRKLYENLRKAVRYYLAVKVALILVSLVAALARLPLPFAPLQIVILELFMDLGASTAFVSQGPEDDLMRRPPRKPNARFFDRSLATGIVAGGVTLAVVTGGAFLFGLSRYSVDHARTLALVGWLVGHAVLGIVMAWERRPISLRGMIANRALVGWAAAAVLFSAVILLVAPVRQALHAGPVPMHVALAVAGAAVVLPLWIDAYKRIRG
jgi:P-type Ca2+ transporter type 2C